MTREAIENAAAAVAASGGSTNARAAPAGHRRGARTSRSRIDEFDTIAERTPVVADLQARRRVTWRPTCSTPAASRSSPASCWKRELIHAGATTVDGRTLGREVADDAVETPGQPVIVPIETPLKPTGGLAILHGNLAPEGCVVKLAGPRAPRTTAGRPAVFDREEDAFAAVKTGAIKAGDVVVIRYEGPAGGPGMREMLHVTAALVGEGLGEHVALHHRRPLLGGDATA